MSPLSPSIAPMDQATAPDLDLEKAEQARRESAVSDLDHNGSVSSISSVSSWHHPGEGPRSMPQPRRSASRASSRVSQAPSRMESTLSRLRSRDPHMAFTHPLGHTKTSSDVIVDFDGPDDPYRPMSWPRRKKITTLMLYGAIAMGSSFNSSVFSAASGQVAAQFHVSQIVTSLGTSMVLLGFGFGPLLWGPLSEVYGRKWVVLMPYFVSIMFAFGCGAATNIQTILICRFWQGIFGSAPITNTGGVLGDIFSAKERGNAMIIYSLSVVGGPMLAPIVGSAIVTSYLRWRWTLFIVGIYQITIWICGVIFLDESYAPVLLQNKASRLRYETGNWALHARHEEWNVSLQAMAKKYLIRPFQLLATPICFLMTFYASFVYGLLYGCLSAFPVVFEQERGWGQVVGSLPFLALLLGLILGLTSNTLNQRPYIRAVDANNGRPVPEARLYPMMFGSVALTAGIFIFAWTSTPDIIWVAPCVGIVLIGAGFFPIFQGALNYILDTFIVVSASAVGASVFMRSVFAAAFPIFMAPMLDAMGTRWGLSVFGFVSIALLPVPYLFFTFGKRIRARGFWSMESTK